MADDFTTFGSAPPTAGANPPSTGWADQLYSSNPLANRYDLTPTNFTPQSYDAVSGGSGGAAAPAVGSGGGFWGNILNVLSTVGKGVDWVEHLPVVNQVEGAWKGFTHGYTMAQNNENNGKGFAGPGVDLAALPQAFKEGFQGLLHPDQARQNLEQDVNQPAQQDMNQTNTPLWAKIGTNLLTGAVQDPTSFIPIGAMAKPLTAAAKAGLSTSVGQAGLDALKASKFVNNKLVNGATDTLGKAFVKNYNANPDLVNILNSRDAEHSANQFNIIGALSQVAKDNGLTDTELNNIGHVMEGTQQGTAAQNALISKLENLRDNGVPNSTSTGTNALTSTLGPDGNPLLQNVLPNYFPHIYRNTPKDLEGVFPKQGYGVPGLSPNGTYQLPRTFATLADAQGKGLKPELNPFQALGEHLSNSSKAVTNAKAIEDIKNSTGILFDKNPIDEMKKLVQTGRVGSLEDAAAQLGMKPEDLKQGFVQSKIPQLSGSYIRPADEAALRNYLEPAAKNSLFDKGLGAWKKVSTFNSLVHGHNILYNGMYLGGAKPSYVADTFKNLKNGADDIWMQRAMKAGAISADRGGFMNNLKSSITASNPIKEKLSYAFHGALWDLDRSLRTSIFRQAIEGGATDAEAAAKANKFLIDYNNLTPFEQSVMTRIFPFYSWMKGNMPLQVQQWITNTPKQTLYEVAKNAVSQGLTGQNMTQDGKIDTGIKLADGSHVLIDPYSPADEPLKMMQQGPLAFLYSKINPLAKEGIDQLTNHAYYPGGPLAPNGKQSMADIPITKPGLPESVNVGASLAHAANSVLPLSGPLGGILGNVVGGSDMRGVIDSAAGLPSKQKPGMTGTELLTRALGGFTSRDNPALDQYYQQRDLQTQIKNQIGYDKQTGQAVPKSLTKQAYKKIPYPVAGQ